MGTKIGKPRTTPPFGARVEHQSPQVDESHSPTDSGALLDRLESLHALATLGTLAGMIAHEFNNLLTPVATYAQMALSNPGDAELTAKALERSVIASEQGARIAHSILQLVKVSGEGHQVPRGTRPSADVRRCIDRAVHCLARHPSKDGIQLEISCEPDMRCAIDEHELTHALINALLNSRSAVMSKDGRNARISVSVTSSSKRPHTAGWTGRTAIHQDASTPTASQPHSWVIIEVADNGRGMTEKELQRMFLPFEERSRTKVAKGTDQAPPPDLATGDRSGTGTGLGTAIMCRLIDNAHGSVEARSQPDFGTAIRFSIPAHPNKHRPVQ